MNKRWIGIGAIALVLALPFVFRGGAGSDAKQVSVEAVAKRQVRASILASGNLVFREQAQLSPEVIGKVSAILVKEGDQVEKGAVVMRLDEQVFRAEVDQHEANVRQQRINIDRQKLNLDTQRRQSKRSEELHARGLLDDNSAENARHAFELAEVDLRASREGLRQAEAMLSQAKERLAKTEIRAPISGTVIAVDIEVGETAVSSATSIAGSSLMTIADTDTLMTEINVDEADIAKISEQQPVSVYAAAFPDTAIDGAVESIPLAPRNGGTGGQSSLARDYSVEVRLLDTKGLALRPGMTCRAEIFTASAAETLAVPVQAVFSNNDASADVAPGKDEVDIEHHLFVEKDGKAERRVVEVGLSDDSYQEITGGLEEGERVVTGPYKVLRHLKDGEALDITDRDKNDEDADSSKDAS
ncbi:MAG: efflux RND transporter periplasmic adaptor subunit [Lysobacteraceae bacterium]